MHSQWHCNEGLQCNEQMVNLKSCAVPGHSGSTQHGASAEMAVSTQCAATNAFVKHVNAVRKQCSGLPVTELCGDAPELLNNSAIPSLRPGAAKGQAGRPSACQ